MKKIIFGLGILALVAGVTWFRHSGEEKSPPKSQGQKHSTVGKGSESTPPDLLHLPDTNRLLTDLAQVPGPILKLLDGLHHSLDTEALFSSLEEQQNTTLAAVVLLRAGQQLYDAGCYSESLLTLEKAWRSVLSYQAKDWKEHKLIAQIGARLGELYARLGRTEELRQVLGEMKSRPVEGAETLAFSNLHQALVGMDQFPEHSFKCGPLALGKIFSILRPSESEPIRVAEIASPKTGFSLAEVVALGKEINFPVTAVRPDSQSIPVPAVIHWRSDHYAAITQVNEGRYLVEDPTFQRSVWMSPEAIRKEASGFFIVPEDKVASGWTVATAEQASSVFGKGAPSQVDSDDQGGDEEDSDCKGLPRAGFNNFYAALTVRDIPLFYNPPVGPPVEVELTYFDASNYDNASASHGHPGKKWLLGWVRHIEIPQLNEAGATFRMVRSNGRTEKFQGVASGGSINVAKTGLNTRSRLSVAGGGGGNPLTNITRSLPDGSTETYGYIADGGNPQGFGAIVGGGAQGGKLYLAESRDPQGNALRFRYVSGTAKLKTVVDAIGQQTTIFYSDAADGVGTDNPSRRLISAIRDPFGRVVRMEYDGEERLVALTDVAGNRTTFAYGDVSFPDFVTSMTTPYGTSSFEKSGTTLTLTDPEGLKEKVSFAFSRNGTPLAGVSGTQALPEEVPSGVAVANGQAYYGFLYYGTTLHWDKKTMRMFGDKADKAHQTRWAQQGNSYTVLTGVPSSRRPAMSHREWYHYQGQPNVGTIGVSSQPTLQVRRIKDENGNPADEVYRSEYNANGYVTRTIDPLGREVVTEYAANGIDVIAVRRKRGASFETLNTFSGYGHDALHRPRYVTDAAGQTTELRWNSRGQLLETTNPIGERTVNAYDANGYLTKIEKTQPGQPANLVTLSTFLYDALGRPRRITSSDGYFIDVEYDALNRIVKTTYPDNTWEGVTYQALSMMSERDRLGRITTHTYNGNMQRVSTTDPANRTLKFEWCSCGALQVLIDAMNRPTRWHYDIMGRQIAKEYVDGSKDLYRYSSASGQVEAIMDAKGNVKTRSYYLDGQVAALRYNNDPKTPDVTFAYDAADGQVTQMTDGVGSTVYTYRAVEAGSLGAGQLATVDGPWDNDVISYTYDALGRDLVRSINDAAQTVAFDSLGRITSTINPLGTFNYGYDGVTSRVTSAAHSGGMKTEYTYFPSVEDHRLQRIKNLKPDGVTSLSVFDYTYDLIGRILSWRQQEDNAAASAKTWTFGYDQADQLVSAVVTQGAAALQNYGWTYDPAANRLTETLNGVTQNSSHNPLNELISTSATLPEMTYEWDAENRLIAVNKGASRTEFMYDGIGRRVRIVEKESGVVTANHTYIWVDFEIAERRDTGGSLSQQRYFPQGFVGLSGGPIGNYLYTTDHLNSVREVVSSPGVVQQRVSYDAWGKPTFSNVTQFTNFSFTGHFWHKQSSLHLAVFRAYSFDIGRWMSRDPIAEEGGINLYRYVSNNPINWWDPLGLVDMNLFSPSEPIHKSAGNTSSNNYSVGGHGNPNTVVDSAGNPISPKDLAEKIKNDPKYKSGSPVDLLSCNTGKGANSYGEKLSKELNAPVYAPDNYVWYYSNGKTVVAPGKGGKLKKPDLTKPGNMNKFEP